MTQEQQDKLRRALYNAKFTTDVEDENPFVGIYFNDLLDIINDFGQQCPQWIPVEKELPEDKQMVLVYLPPDEICDHEYMCEALYNYDWHGWESDEPIDLDGLTHWMEIYPPRKEG